MLIFNAAKIQILKGIYDGSGLQAFIIKAAVILFVFIVDRMHHYRFSHKSCPCSLNLWQGCCRVCTVYDPYG
jgi:hypothetical protein